MGSFAVRRGFQPVKLIFETLIVGTAPAQAAYRSVEITFWIPIAEHAARIEENTQTG
jgi:hypothetical protein